MKKVLCFVAVWVMVLLSGCAKAGEVVAETPAPVFLGDETIDETPIATPDNEAPTPPPEEYTIAEICNGLREDWKHWSWKYETAWSDWVKIDNHYYYYWDTYPDREWTPEDVAEYFRGTSRWRWGCEIGKTSDESKKFYLWTSDYEHEFVANTETNWLYIDGVKAAPLETETSSMNPKDLIEAFQSRKWDGVTPRYSEDFSTSVVMNQEYGLLEYEFQLDHYSAETDPNGVAYTSYANDAPWWQDEKNGYGVVTMLDHEYTSSNNGINDGVAAPYYHTDRRRTQSNTWAIAYVDVPWELQERLLAVQHAGEFYYVNAGYGQCATHDLYARRNSDGLYALTDSGVELWRAGRLRQAWQLEITEDSYLLIDYGFSGNNFVYTDGKFYRLFDDGEIEVVIDDIVSVNFDYRDYFACGCFTLSDDGVLRMCYFTKDDEIVEREIATEVLAADLSDDDFVLYTDKSGIPN